MVIHFGQTAVDAALTYGKPTVIVYNPEWRTAAGLQDARLLAGKLNAVLVEELTVGRLEKARTTRPPRYPDGAKRLADEIAAACQ